MLLLVPYAFAVCWLQYAYFYTRFIGGLTLSECEAGTGSSRDPRKTSKRLSELLGSPWRNAKPAKRHPYPLAGRGVTELPFAKTGDLVYTFAPVGVLLQHGLHGERCALHRSQVFLDHSERALQATHVDWLLPGRIRHIRQRERESLYLFGVFVDGLGQSDPGPFIVAVVHCFPFVVVG